MRFIECKDAFGENCLIDPLSVQLVEQCKENGKPFCIVYFTNGIHAELAEPYEEIKRKFNEYVFNEIYV